MNWLKHMTNYMNLAFTWMETDEGHYYWKEVSLSLLHNGWQRQNDTRPERGDRYWRDVYDNVNSILYRHYK